MTEQKENAEANRIAEMAELNRRVAIDVFGWKQLTEARGKKQVILWEMPSGDQTQTEKGEGFAESDFSIGVLLDWFTARGLKIELDGVPKERAVLPPYITSGHVTKPYRATAQTWQREGWTRGLGDCLDTRTGATASEALCCLALAILDQEKAAN